MFADVLTDQQVRQLLSAASSRSHKNAQRDHAFLSVVVSTGIGPGKAVRLTRSQVLKLAEPATGLGAVVSAYCQTTDSQDPDDLVFPFSVRQAERIFGQYARRANLPAGVKLFSLSRTGRSRVKVLRCTELDRITLTTMQGEEQWTI